MSVTSTNAAGFDPSSYYTTSGSSQPSSSLDKDGFLKLLTAQMSNQDPQSSQDPSQYFNTISQMTMVEQLTNLSTAAEQQRAAGLIGKSVTYTNTDGQVTSGVVDSVQFSGTTTKMSVDGVGGVDPASIMEVK